MQNNSKNIQKLLLTIVIVIIINLLGSQFFLRFDLTQDNRYTLSETSLNIVKNIDEPLYVDVYLEGDFPSEFKKLQTETQQLLQEFKARNSNVIFQFIDPLADKEKSQSKSRELFNKGLTPISITVDDKGKQEQTMVFPWAIARYKDQEIKVQLLKNMLGASTADKVVSSVQHLEYAFANAINTISVQKQKQIAVILGNEQLQQREIGDFLKTVKENYFIAPFTLDSVSKNAVKTAKDLKYYDLAIIAKPREKFTDEEKQVLDQFIVNGGKTLWLLDNVNAEMEDLNQTGTTLAFPNDLNLNEMFFKYGIRMNPELIKDEQCIPIKLATGEQGSKTEYQQYFWKFSPFIYPETEHPIVKNIDGIKFEFANPIELLKNDLKKTILLRSSEYSKKVGAPVQINLNMVEEKSDKSEYFNKGNLPVAVLLEGKFTSMFNNRVLPFDDNSFVGQSKIDNKMIVVADGDVIKNQIDKDGNPLELGFDKWTNNVYGNKEFIMNCVNFLLDDNGLINIRSKDVSIPLLDKEKVFKNYGRNQFIAVGFPLVILTVFGLLFTYLRKRKYSK